MGMFVNSIIPAADYAETVADLYFVDKSALIRELIPALGKKNRYFCFTRPRRFGKNVLANMTAAFFGKAQETGGLFDGQSISRDEAYREHMNRHNVMFIDFS